MNGPEQRPLLAQPAGLNARTLRLLRVLLLAAAAAVFGLLYLLSAEFRSETNRALGILGRGDIAGLRDYIVSFGLWAPVASCFLMVLQALVAPVPSFLITFKRARFRGVLGLDALLVRARARGGRVLWDLTRPRQGPRRIARREDGSRIGRPLVRAVGSLRRIRRTAPTWCRLRRHLLCCGAHSDAVQELHSSYGPRNLPPDIPLLVSGSPGTRVRRPVPGDLGSRGSRSSGSRRYQVQE